MQIYHHTLIPDLHQALFLKSVRGLCEWEYSELHTTNTRIFLVAKLSRSDCRRLEESGFHVVCCLLCSPDSTNDAVYDWYLTRQDGLRYDAGKKEYREQHSCGEVDCSYHLSLKRLLGSGLLA